MDSSHACLAVISLDSALNKDGNYYLQLLLEDCECIWKKVIKYINDDLESSSDNSGVSDEE